MSNIGTSNQAVVSAMPGRKEAEGELSEGEAKFRALADAVPVMIWVSNTSAQCVFVNGPWLKFVGRTFEQELLKGWSASLHEDDIEACLDLYRASFAERKDFTIECRMKRSDGEYRWILDTGVPWFEANGEFGGYVGSCIDVTERKLVEIELQRKAEEQIQELKKAHQEMESFSYSVSHDLRAPLRSVSSNLAFLVEDYGKDLTHEARDYVNRAKDAAGRMDSLMQGILQLSRLSRKEQVVTDVDLSALADAVGKERTPNGQDVEIKIQPGLHVQGDVELLRTVLENLISNSLKYGGTKVEFCQGDGAFLVRDNGIGFDPQYSSKLFQPFERLHSAATYPGAGVGLASVKRIIERHGGKVWAESEEGKGATFYFTIAESPTETSPKASGT